MRKVIILFISICINILLITGCTSVSTDSVAEPATAPTETASETSVSEGKAENDEEESEEVSENEAEDDDEIPSEDEFKDIYSKYIDEVRQDDEHKDMAIRDIQIVDTDNNKEPELIVLWKNNDKDIQEVYCVTDNKKTVNRIFQGAVNGYNLWCALYENGNKPGIYRITDIDGVQYILNGTTSNVIFIPLPKVTNGFSYLVAVDYAKLVPEVYERAKNTPSDAYEEMLYITADEMELIWAALIENRVYADWIVPTGVYITSDMDLADIRDLWDKGWYLTWRYYYYHDIDLAELEAAERAAAEYEAYIYQKWLEANAAARKAKEAKKAALNAQKAQEAAALAAALEAEEYYEDEEESEHKEEGEKKDKNHVGMCPKCGSHNISGYINSFVLFCEDCGYEGIVDEFY